MAEITGAFFNLSFPISTVEQLVTIATQASLNMGSTSVGQRVIMLCWKVMSPWTRLRETKDRAGQTVHAWTQSQAGHINTRKHVNKLPNTLTVFLVSVRTGQCQNREKRTHGNSSKSRVSLRRQEEDERIEGRSDTSALSLSLSMSTSVL